MPRSRACVSAVTAAQFTWMMLHLSWFHVHGRWLSFFTCILLLKWWCIEREILRAINRRDTPWCATNQELFLRSISLAAHQPVSDFWRPQTSLVGAYFSHCNPNDKITSCYTIRKDGALFRYTVPSILKWNTQYNRVWQQERSESTSESQAHRLVNAMWTIQSRQYFHREGASVTAASYCQH
jgi:hypothetical protein